VPFDVSFEAPIWAYDGPGGWHFVTLPKRLSHEIHASAATAAKPGGSLPVTAIIGATRWKTSIFWDRKRDAYLLPVKAAVRTKEQLREGDSPEIALVAGFTIG